LAVPKRATLLALALAELVRQGAAVDLDSTSGPVTDVTLVLEARTDLAPPPTRPQGAPGHGSSPELDPDQVAPGDVEPVEAPSADPTRSRGWGGVGSPVLLPPADPRHAPTPAAGADRCERTADDPLGMGGPFDPCAAVGRDRIVDLVGQCHPATTPDGSPVPPPVAEVLLCDPAIVALIIDTLGVPLDLGRTTRLANRAQRRALAHRDGGCVFPGCDMPVTWCDAHHVTPWQTGGTTDIAHLALLCRYHHGVTHRHGWTMTTHPDQTFTWTTPHGHTLHSQRHRGRSPTADILQPT
jgi:hypothetical protein